MQLPPTSVLVNWPTPNYEHPKTQGLPLVIVNVIFMTLISLAVPLRLYGRFRNKGRLGWDDFNMAIAYVRLAELEIRYQRLIAAYRSSVLPLALLLFSPTFDTNGTAIYGMSSSPCSNPLPLWPSSPSFCSHSPLHSLAHLSFVFTSASSKILVTVYLNGFSGQHLHTTLPSALLLLSLQCSSARMFISLPFPRRS